MMVAAAVIIASAILVSGEKNPALPHPETTDLDKIQFLFAEVGGHFCSTNWQPTQSLKQTLDRLMDNGRLERHLPKPGPVPHDVEDIALKELGQGRGDWFIGFNVIADDVLLLRLSGVALEPSGDGSYSGFLGRFEVIPDVVLEGSARPTGVCFRIDDIRNGGQIQASAESTRVEPVVEAEVVRGVHKHFGADLTIKNLRKITGNPRYPLFVGEILRVDNTTILFALKDESGNLVPIPFFNPNINSEESSLLLEDPDPDNDGAMYDTSYTYLADMDGNGLSELFVSSTVSYFFALEEVSGRARWRMIKSYYRGP